jgi:hypothetical protein
MCIGTRNYREENKKEAWPVAGLASFWMFNVFPNEKTLNSGEQ